MARNSKKTKQAIDRPKEILKYLIILGVSVAVFFYARSLSPEITPRHARLISSFNEEGFDGLQAFFLLLSLVFGVFSSIMLIFNTIKLKMEKK